MGNGRIAFALVMLALCSVLQADADLRSLTNRLAGAPNATITTDLQVQPTFSSGAANNVVCVGSTLSPIITVDSSWYISAYSTKLRSNAEDVSCLLTYATLTTNQPVKWVTNSQYSSISSKLFFDDVPQFESFMSGIGVSPAGSLEGSGYIDGLGNMYPGLYKGNTSLYAKGTIEIISNNSAYSSLVTNEYAGSVPSVSIVLSQVGSYSFKSRFNLTNVIATGRTHLLSSVTCQGKENVYVYRNNTAANHSFESSPEVTVSVENPFSCNISASSPSYTPPNPAAGTVINFTFSLGNNDFHPISVTSIALAPGSNFSNLQLAPPRPFVVAAHASQVITGNVTVPNTGGIHELRFVLNGDTTEPDCTNTGIKHCTNQIVPVVNVTVAGAVTLSCGFVSHSPSFFPGQSAQVRANCTMGGLPQCPALNWSVVNLTGANMVPPQTSQAPSPVFSLFNTSTSAPVPQYGAVRATCADASVCTQTCEFPAELLPPPDNCTLFFPSHSNQFTSTETAATQANCTAAGNFSTACPSLGWETNVTNASMSPVNTIQMRDPQSNFSTVNAPVQVGYVRAGSTDPQYPLLCTPINVSVVVLGPDYTIPSINSTTPNPNVGDTVIIDVVVRNIGQNDTNILTLTQMNATNCSAAPQQINTPGLDAGESTNPPLSFTCICGSYGFQTVYAIADVDNALVETNENNNMGSTTFFCGGMSYVPQCRDYV